MINQQIPAQVTNIEYHNNNWLHYSQQQRRAQRQHITRTASIKNNTKPVHNTTKFLFQGE